jgi:prophage regulatory protein
MRDWSVRLEIGGVATEDQLIELLEKLGPSHGAVVSGNPGESQFGVRLTANAEGVGGAIRQALRVVGASLRVLGVVGFDIVAGEVQTMESLVLENLGETDLVGLSDIAAQRGISRQRVDQLTRVTGFPEPAVVLRSGRVWRRSDVQTFLERRRPPGRPRIGTA